MTGTLVTIDGITLNGRPFAFVEPVIEPDPYCAVCGRVTDHVAEHDDLVDRGICDYGDFGQVFFVNGWNRRDFAVYWTIFVAYNPNWWKD